MPPPTCDRCEGRTLKLQPTYRIAELADMAELSQGQMRRLLESHGVQLRRCGRVLLVPLSELVDKLDWLRHSWRVLDAHRAIAAAGGCDGG